MRGGADRLVLGTYPVVIAMPRCRGRLSTVQRRGEGPIEQGAQGNRMVMCSGSGVQGRRGSASASCRYIPVGKEAVGSVANGTHEETPSFCRLLQV